MKKATLTPQIIRTAVGEYKSPSPVQTVLRFLQPGKEDCPLTVEKAAHRQGRLSRVGYKRATVGSEHSFGTERQLHCSGENREIGVSDTGSVNSESSHWTSQGKKHPATSLDVSLLSCFLFWSKILQTAADQGGLFFFFFSVCHPANRQVVSNKRCQDGV